MKILFLPFILIFVGITTGCSSNESEMQEIVRSQLKDPDSAKFGQFTMIGDKHFCLTVNARNSMGGYTGDQQVYGVNFGNAEIGDFWHVTFLEGLHRDCVSVQTQLSRS